MHRGARADQHCTVRQRARLAGRGQRGLAAPARKLSSAAPSERGCAAQLTILHSEVQTASNPAAEGELGTCRQARALTPRARCCGTAPSCATSNAQDREGAVPLPGPLALLPPPAFKDAAVARCRCRQAGQDVRHGCPGLQARQDQPGGVRAAAAGLHRGCAGQVRRQGGLPPVAPPVGLVRGAPIRLPSSLRLLLLAPACSLAVVHPVLQ